MTSRVSRLGSMIPLGSAANVQAPRRWMAVVSALGLAVALAAPAASQAQKGSPGFILRVRPADAATESGFNNFYNMQYSAAIADFETALSNHPNDPYAVNHLLEAVLIGELHREGKLDAQLYLGSGFVHFNKIPPEPRAERRIAELTTKALRLENQSLERQPNDASTLYARSVTQGLQATEEALIGKEWFTSLRSGLAAYDDSTRVLDLDPSHSDAKLVVGIYNYVVGSLPLALKMAAFLATIHGRKAKGLDLMREAADGGGEASIDARTSLALFLARERRYSEALEINRWLYQTFPHNFLYGFSEAFLLKTSDHVPEAIQAYRRLIDLGKQGMFPGERIELATLDLGNTLRSQRDWRDAAQAYGITETIANADPEILGRTRLAAGQMYDLLGERSLAVKEYEKVLDGTDEEEVAKAARQGLKNPYRGE